MKFSIERKLALGFVVAVCGLLLVMGAALHNAARFGGTHRATSHTYEVLHGLSDALTDVLSMQAHARGYVLTGNEDALQGYEASAKEIETALTRLRELARNNPDQRGRIDQLARLARRARESLGHRISLRRTGGIEAAADTASYREAQAAVDDFRRGWQETAAAERQLLNEDLARAERAGGRTLVTIVAASLIAIGLAALAAGWVRRDLLRRRDAERALQESFARVEDLYNNAPCGYLSINESGTFVAINNTALAWLGLARDDVVGKMRFLDILSPESATLFPQRFEHFLHTGAVQNVEYEWRRKDGSILPVLLNATAIRDAHGRYVASRATVFDITKRKRAERERDRFFTLSRDLLCVTNFDGYFTRLNPAWQRVLGYSTDDLMTRPLLEFVHPDDREKTAAEAARLAAGQDTIDFENRYRCRDGSYRWLQWTASGIASERVMFGSARDVTDRRESEARIQTLNSDLTLRAQQLEAANRELESFSYSVSHDLRAPLRHIDGFAGLLSQHAGDSLDAESRRYIGVISKAAKQMGMLIDDLLAFSRIGRATVRLQRIDHQQLVTTIIADGRYNEGRSISWEIGSLPESRADAAMLRQVWVNLIDNAVKYSSKSPQPRIEIGGHAAPTTNEYVYFVRDNGVGFDMAYGDKLFGVFQRLHGPSEFEGTGIGLANVRRIIARHGGRTWAEGQVGQGATFYFSLPVNAANAAPAS